MGWLKRNLFFAIGSLLALGLLGLAGFYFYVSWQRNHQAFAKLNEIYNTKQQINQQKPSPGNEKTDNIKLANEQTDRLRQWVSRARTSYFQPIAPIPNPTNGPLTSELFAHALHRTIAQLKDEAAAANVTLPPPPPGGSYNFSFQAQSDAVKFAPGSVELLAQQLGEVKAISEILYASSVNELEGIQRVRVSDDDAQGPAGDYLADSSATNELAVLTPYQVTFRSFSPEIARVLAAFAASPHGFLVRGVNVQPASAVGVPGNYAGMGGETPLMPYQNPPAAPGPPPPAPMSGQRGLQTVLNEQLLRVALEVEIVKLR